MTLSLYIARRFLRAIMMVVGAFFTILFIIEMLEQLRRFSSVGATLTDAAGNTSLASSALNFTLDTAAPSAPGLDLTAVSDSGADTGDGLTNVTAPVIRVSFTASEVSAGAVATSCRVASSVWMHYW